MISDKAERQIILISAGVAARREAMGTQARALMNGVEWIRFAETLHARKLLPVLGPRVLQMAQGSASESFASAVEGALEVGRRRGAFFQMIALRLLSMLADAGIRAAALKGPLLAEAIYGDVGCRLSGDIDLLVAPDQLSAAVGVVRELGYGAPLDPVEREGLPLLHFALPHERQTLPPVELHWRVHWHERNFARERLLPAEIDPDAAWRPAPVDELAALLLFYARDGFIDLCAAADLSAWWDARGAELRGGEMGELLRLYPAFTHIIPASLRVAERIVGLPAERILGYAPRLSLRSRMAVWLANPNPRADRTQLYADKGLIDGLLTRRRDIGTFIRRELLPPHEVRALQARHAGRSRARSPLVRCVGVLARYMLTMTRLLRGAEAIPGESAPKQSV